MTIVMFQNEGGARKVAVVDGIHHGPERAVMESLQEPGLIGNSFCLVVFDDDGSMASVPWRCVSLAYRASPVKCSSATFPYLASQTVG